MSKKIGVPQKTSDGFLVYYFHWLRDNQQYVAWFFFLCMFAGLLLYDFAPRLSYVAVLSYLGAVTALMVTIYKNTQQQPRIYKHLLEANLSIFDEIDHALKRPDCEICWIGVTLTNAWQTLESYLSEPIKQETISRLKIRLLQCSPDYLRSILLDDDLTATRARHLYDTIIAFSVNEGDHLRATNSTVDIAQYAYMPNYHGVLINRKVLFLSTVRWEAPNFDALSVANEPYERFDSDDARGDYMIRLYLCWLERGYKQNLGIHKSNI